MIFNLFERNVFHHVKVLEGYVIEESVKGGHKMKS